MWWWILAGCGPNVDELGELRDDHLRLVSEIRARLEPLESLAARHAKGDGEYVYSGHVDGFGWWTGGVDVDGRGVISGDDTLEEYDLDLVLTDVVLGELTVDGAERVGITIAASYDGIAFSYDMEGELTVRGAWSGEIAFDHAYASDLVTDTWTGTFDGRDAASL